jgi:hypothetical protein
MAGEDIEKHNLLREGGKYSKNAYGKFSFRGNDNDNPPVAPVQTNVKEQLEAEVTHRYEFTEVSIKTIEQDNIVVCFYAKVVVSPKRDDLKKSLESFQKASEGYWQNNNDNLDPTLGVIYNDRYWRKWYVFTSVSKEKAEQFITKHGQDAKCFYEENKPKQQGISCCTLL